MPMTPVYNEGLLYFSLNIHYLPPASSMQQQLICVGDEKFSCYKNSPLVGGYSSVLSSSMIFFPVQEFWN